MDDMKLLSRSSVRQERMPSSHGCRISVNVKMTLELVGSSARGPSHGEYFVVEPYVIMFTQLVEVGMLCGGFMLATDSWSSYCIREVCINWKMITGTYWWLPL